MNCAFSFFLAGLISFGSATASQALPGRPLVGPYLNGKLPSAAPSIPSAFELEVAFPNIAITNLLGVAPVPGTTKLAAWEREGRIWVFEDDPAASEKTLVLDISDRCQGWGAPGLVNVAFHPGFVTNGYLFLNYTWVKPGTIVGDPYSEPPEQYPGNYHDRISRFTWSEDLQAVSDSELVFVDQVTDSTFHNGGGMFFHPEDGFLYWSNGDDNGAPTQVIDQDLLSGAFRIDVDQRGGDISHPIPRQPLRGTTANYYIPNDNPFVGMTNALEEFYALGLRNPFRMTYDPLSRRIFIGDVGNFSREEIDVIEPSDPPGLNFQWEVVEGIGGSLFPPYIGVNKAPLLDYSRADGICIIGGEVYRGTEFAAELGGRYIFGDNGSRYIWALDESTYPASKVLLAQLPYGSGPAPHIQYQSLSSFALDSKGELLICQLGGSGGYIYKLKRSAPGPEVQRFPKTLSETTVFADTAAMRISDAFIPYDVNSPLWSDGAGKGRWFTIPTNTTIRFAASGEWGFPAGSVFVKHFELPADETDPAAPPRRLETRLLIRDEAGGVFGATYKWRPDNSDADLLEAQLDEEIEIRTADGIRKQLWHYPSTAECLQCHTPASKGVLGPNARQLNRELLYPSGVTTNQLAALNAAGLLYPAPRAEELAALPRLAAVTNTTDTLELRVRSYLDSNCAHCHRPGGSRAFWDARFDTPLVLSSILNGPVSQSFGIPDARTIVPGHPDKSIILHRAGSLDASVKMPPIAKGVIDTNAVALLAEYIGSLPPVTNSLPGGWQLAELGTLSTPSGATYAAQSLNITAGNGDIWGTADTLAYVYQTLEGDGEITARIASIANGGSWARTGIMIRESLEQGSRHAFVCLGARQGVGFFSRSETGGITSSVRAPGVTAPIYFRLERTGSRIAGATSPDGVTWEPLGSVELDLPAKVFIGFPSCANAETAANFTIDQVRTVNVPPFNSAPEITLAGAPANGTAVAGPLLLTATVADGDGYIPMVEFFDGAERLGQATGEPFRLLVTVGAGNHRFSARAYDQLADSTLVTSEAIEVKPLELTLAAPIGEDVFSFSFQGNPGITYITESSTDLSSWEPAATNTPASDGVSTVTVPYTGAGSMFRVRPR